MEVVDQGQLIMPEQDSNPMPFKCPMHKPCRLPDSLEEADYPNNDVCSDDWCTMPQSSGADVKVRKFYGEFLFFFSSLFL